MTAPSNRHPTGKDVLTKDAQFALTVAARAAVRASGINPFEDACVACTPVRIGAWPKDFGAVLVVCSIDEAPVVAQMANALLSENPEEVWAAMTPGQRKDALAEWHRITTGGQGDA